MPTCANFLSALSFYENFLNDKVTVVLESSSCFEIFNFVENFIFLQVLTLSAPIKLRKSPRTAAPNQVRSFQQGQKGWGV